MYITQNFRPKNLMPVEESFYDPLLVSLLTKCTPHKYEFHIVRIIKEFLKDTTTNYTLEEIEDNVLIRVGKSESMFSCHMDMVGDVWSKNAEKGLVDSVVLMGDIINEKNKGYLWGSKYLVTREKKFLRYEPSTLGADDKVGVYILLKMIDAGIPGLYVFHVGEECGGVGSKKLTTSHKELFKDFKRAIAFDRAGYGDIIERQRGGQCSSNKFGKALAEQLNPHMPPFQKFKEGVSGTFTDTANYIEIIPECTNISVGYFNQHGKEEKLDYIWLKSVLLPAILKLDFESLPTERNPKETSFTYTLNYNDSWYNHNDLGRASWKTANASTPNDKLPKWQPDYGLVDGVDENVMKRSIQGYFVTAYQQKEKEELGERYFELLEYNELLLEEIASKDDQIKRLTKGNKSDIKKETKPDDLPKTSKIESLIIHKRKDLLDKLIQASKDYGRSISPKNQKILEGYARGAANFLAESKEKLKKSDFSNKQIKKLNKMIFMMAYLLSLNEFDIDTDDLSKILIDCHAHITAHISEAGFEQGKVEDRVVH